MQLRSSLTSAASSAVRRTAVMLFIIATTAVIAAPVASAHEQASRWNNENSAASRFLPASLVRGLGAASALGRPASTLHWTANPAIPDPAVTVQVGGNPVGALVDPTTHTLYVANGTTNNVSVINTLTCNARQTTGCSQSPPTVATGPGPLAFALDPATDTLYVTNLDNGGGDTVSMIDTATCNASNTFGCGQTAPQVTVGPGPALLTFDPATDTVYVANSSGDTVSMIDAATCNVSDNSGCTTVPSVTAGSGATAVAIDPATHTAYVPNLYDGTVTVFDTSKCSAMVSTGCAGPLPTITLGPNTLPSAAVIDEPSDTVYVPISGPSLGGDAMINGATCNASDASGCDQTPQIAPTGNGPIWIDENAKTRTVYSVNQGDSDISVIGAATCNATDSSGCQEVPPALAIDFDGGGDVVDPTTDTVYGTSQNNNTVTVLNGATCNGKVTGGCSNYAPTTDVGNADQPIVLDAGTHTAYVANVNDGTISVVDTAACNIGHLSGCGQAWPTINLGNGFADYYGLAVNPSTHTLYASNANGDTVAVINTASCNAATASGCGQTPESITVGNGAAGIAIDQVTDTVYVANGNDNTVSVIDGASCNAETISGCGQTPPTISTGNGPLPVALNPATHTLYVGNLFDNTVSVINAATCNDQTQTDCNETAPTVGVADGPFSLGVDQMNNTVYVANTGVEIFFTGYANLTSSVSIINGATCNSTDVTGCANTPASVPVGGMPFGLVVDQSAQTVYVDSIVDSDVTRFSAGTCNGTSTSNCHTTVLNQFTGGWPAYLAVDDAAGTLYVTNSEDATLGLFKLH